MTYQGDTKARPVPAFSCKCVFIYLRLNFNILEDLYLLLYRCSKIHHLKVMNKIVICHCIFFLSKLNLWVGAEKWSLNKIRSASSASPLQHRIIVVTKVIKYVHCGHYGDQICSLWSLG